jgi:hypothetical protein
MDGTGDHYVKQNNPDSERKILYVFSHLWYLDLKTEKDTIWGRGRLQEGEGREGDGGVNMIKV